MREKWYLLKYKIFKNIFYYRIISSWPNTYAFTKALAEDYVRRKNKGLPIGIFRPAIGNFYFQYLHFNNSVTIIYSPDANNFLY